MKIIWRHFAPVRRSFSSDKRIRQSHCGDGRSEVGCFAGNMKVPSIALVFWCFAIVPMGFSETYQYRPAQTEMDETVTLGAECLHGVNERCFAAQVNPPFIQTNAAGWYIHQNLVGQMASTIRSLVPYYVNTNIEYNGIATIPMLTVTGLWAQLGIGDHTNQFTVAATDTYGDYPSWINLVHLQERYKVLEACEETAPNTAAVTSEYWYGHGTGTTMSAARSAAVSDYSPSANPVSFMQDSFNDFYSNRTYVSGGHYESGTGDGHDPGEWWYTYYVDLVNNTFVSGTNWYIACTNSWILGYGDYATNILMSGVDLVPNVSGEYKRFTPGIGENGYGYPAWGSTNGYYIYWNAGAGYHQIGPFAEPYFYISGGPAGTWSAGLGSGTPYAVYDTGTNSLTNLPGPDCSGLYELWSTSYNGFYAWTNGIGYRLYYDGSQWIIDDGSFNASEPYWVGGTPTHGGSYNPINHESQTTFSNVLVYSIGPLDPSGEYEWVDSNRWAGGGWYVDCAGGASHITTNLTTLAPAWEGSALIGDYPNHINTGTTMIYGVATTYIMTNWGSGPDDYWVVDYQTYTWETSTIFYSSRTRKAVGSFHAYTSTNVEHKVKAFYVFPTAPEYANSNIFYDQGLGLTQNVWSCIGGSNWSFASNNVVALGSDIETPPAEAPEPVVANESVARGFKVESQGQSIVDWNFLYCTNSWW